MASSGVANDMSVEKLAQTQDAEGNSVPMMAVEAGQKNALHFLLSLPAHFRADCILIDVNDDGVTLLSAAVQSGNVAVTEELLHFLEINVSEQELKRYLAVQDSKGRCVGHYLFHQPHLIQRFGKYLPWRLKDKNGQTPLFALSRSYDHDQYHTMIDTALSLAAETQGDGKPLHHDDHRAAIVRRDWRSRATAGASHDRAQPRRRGARRSRPRPQCTGLRQQR